MGPFPREDCKEKLKKEYFSKLSPKETYLQSDWTCTVLLYFVNHGDPFLKPCVQVYTSKDDSFSPPPLPCTALHPASRGTGLGSGPLTWMNPQETLASTFFLFRLEILISCTLSWCQGPDIILTHVLRLWQRLRLQGTIWVQKAIGFLDLRYRKDNCRTNCLLKKTANDTASQKCRQTQGSWAESQPPCLSPGCPGAFLADVSRLQRGLFCFYIVSRKLRDHFKDQSRISLRKRGVVRSRGWGPLGKAGADRQCIGKQG